MGWQGRLRRTIFGSDADRAIEAEVGFHIDERADEYVRAGMAPDDARLEALRRFGGRSAAIEGARDASTLPWLRDAAHDLRYAVRTLRRNPGFAAAALATLALGIGATTAVFSVVYGVLLRPLPYPDADRLVRVWEEHPGGTTATGARWISNRTYYAWLERPRAIDAIGAFGTRDLTLRIDTEDTRLVGADVSPALMRILGAHPIAGRLFDDGEAETGAEPVLILSEALWRGRFGADPRVIGRSVTAEGRRRTIVGVVADGFRFPDEQTRVWTPYVIRRVSTDPAQSQATSAISVIARLTRGVTAAQAETEGTAFARSVPVTLATQALFGKGAPAVVHTRPLAADMTGDVRPALFVLAASVACLLLVACVNVANLSLSRGLARQRELAVRASIGAGRWRLARQLLTEHLTLAAGGGAAGIAVAWALVRVARVLAPRQFPRLADAGIDGRVLAFAALAAFAAALLAGLVPALRGSRVDVFESLRGGDGAAGGVRSLRARRLRDLLLASEAALAIVLLVGATLLIRSFVRLTHVDGGYSPQGVITARVLMPQGAPPERTAQFTTQALARLRARQGITAAGAGNMVPFYSLYAISTFPILGAAGDRIMTRSLTYTVTPGYAEALGLRLRAGRFFDERDASATSGGILIVNEEFARQYLTGGPIVGRRFNSLVPAERGAETEIVGLVGPMLKDGNDRQPQPEIYGVAGNGGRRFGGGGSLTFVVRGTRDPAALAREVRQVLRDIDRDVTMDAIEPLNDALSRSVAQPRFAMAVLVSFALVGLALASVGLYGVQAYAVSQRRRELGVRAALGASPGALRRLVLREGLIVTAVGAAVGLLGAASVSRLMQAALFGVTPLDAASFAAAPIVLLTVAAAACLIPASRAAAIGPAEALRTE